MSSANEQCSKAYAKQAIADLLALEVLVRANTHKCHPLHFLQVADEKACNAHLTLANRHDRLRLTNACVPRNPPTMARYFYALLNDNNVISHWKIAEISRLADEIEVLALASDGGNLRQDNSEYPWLDGREVVKVPCEYSFPNVDNGSQAITRLIRVIHTAAEAYAA